MSDELIQIKYTLDTINYNSDKIRTKLYTVNGTSPSPSHMTHQYKILNYDLICDNDDSLGLYRSIILSHPENKIVCFSPPKSVTLDHFKETNPDITNPDIFINEIIEGTMINLFYDSRIESWQIATKGAIGGNYSFYKMAAATSEATSESAAEAVAAAPPPMTFRQMFLDALRVPSGQDVNDFVGFADFSKDYCYNFVLQHPQNHIVLSIPYPVVYLVSVYHIVGDPDNQVVYIPPTVYEEWDCFLGLRGLIEFPKHLNDEVHTAQAVAAAQAQAAQAETSYTSLTEKYGSPLSESYETMGCMIMNLNTGMRTTIINPKYTEVRELRGNNPNLCYQYLCLKRMGKVMDFLKHFPQYKNVFYRFHTQYENFITNIHQAYLIYYVKKSGIKIAKRYFQIIYKLHHEYYLPSLSSSDGKRIMRRSEIKQIMNKIEFNYVYTNFIHAEREKPEVCILNEPACIPQEN